MKCTEGVGTVRAILCFLELDAPEVVVSDPAFDKLADASAEIWVQRYRQERQAGWANPAW